ncbi:MAG: DUF6691 family protein [Pseudobdellovibrionaceae bacterium]|jgi:uncharacterized membrane protein YedE/YeeE
MKKTNLASLLSGFILGFGFILAGWGQPENFLQVFKLQGTAVVHFLIFIGAALLFHFWAFKTLSSLQRPLFDHKKHIPHGKDVSTSMILGAALFGVGIALGGFDPAAALASVGAGSQQAIVFAIAMTVGMAIHHFVRQILSSKNQL